MQIGLKRKWSTRYIHYMCEASINQKTVNHSGTFRMSFGHRQKWVVWMGARFSCTSNMSLLRFVHKLNTSSVLLRYQCQQAKKKRSQHILCVNDCSCDSNKRKWTKQILVLLSKLRLNKIHTPILRYINPGLINAWKIFDFIY